MLGLKRHVLHSVQHTSQARLTLLCRETVPEWDKEIAEDVKGECGKFGAVSHIYVDRNSKVSPCAHYLI